MKKTAKEHGTDVRIVNVRDQPNLSSLPVIGMWTGIVGCYENSRRRNTLQDKGRLQQEIRGGIHETTANNEDLW